MSQIPPPTSFAEGQRAIALWLMAAAGVFAGIMIVAIIALLTWGGWSVDNEHTIILIIGGALAGFAFSMIAVILALAVCGPVGRFHADASRSGVGFDLGAKDDQAPKPTITTTTEIKPS